MSAPSLPRPTGTAGDGLFVKAFLLLWLVGLSAICLTGDITCVRHLIRQSAAARFHQAPGTVARIDRLPQTDRRGRVYFDIQATYAYEVAGRQYEGHNLRPGYDYFDEAWAATHRVGTPLTVLYNPADPGDAVLEPGNSVNSWMFLMGLVPLNALTLFSWGIALMALTRRLPARTRDRGLTPDDGRGSPEARTAGMLD
jgi:hypothetical protein